MWLMYALGGGWGHLTRAVSLARVAPASVRIVTNCPYADYVSRAIPGLDLRWASSRDAVLSEMQSAASRCDRIIVDTFPRGLLGELADWLPLQSIPRVLVARDLNPDYVESFALQAFVAKHYDLVLLPGEGEAFVGFSTAPWLACPVPEPESNRETVFICATGNQEEQAWYGEVAALLCQERQRVSCVSPACPPGCPPEHWRMHWPALELLGSASAVVGGAGYNLVYETQAARVALIARPWPRLYDRQALRAERAGATIVTTPEEAVKAVRRHAPCQRNPGTVGDGPQHAAVAIGALVNKR
jgi:hypothetical protein